MSDPTCPLCHEVYDAADAVQVAVHGGPKIETIAVCDPCGDTAKKCGECDGEGEIEKVCCGPRWNARTSDCPCGGYTSEPCDPCAGTGKIIEAGQ